MSYFASVYRAPLRHLCFVMVMVSVTAFLVGCRPPNKEFGSTSSSGSGTQGAMSTVTPQPQAPPTVQPATPPPSINSSVSDEDSADTDVENTSSELVVLPFVNDQQSTDEVVRTVRAVIAELGELRATRSTSVTIEPSQESNVASKASGQLQRIFHREGAQVAKGDQVMQLDNTSARLQVENAQLQLESARINLQKASRSTGETGGQLQVQLKSAQSSLERAEQRYLEAQALYEVGGIAQVELLGLEAEYQQAQASLTQIQDSLNQTSRASQEDLALLEVQVRQAQAQLESAQIALNDTQITAPFAGEITDLLAEEGEFVSTGNPVFRLVSVEKQLGRFSVPPEDAEPLKAIGTITIAHDGQSYPATIIRSSRASSSNRLVGMTAELAPSERTLPSGSVGQLEYTVLLAQGVKIPSGAIVSETGSNYVFALIDSVATRVDIALVAEVGGEAVIEGVAGGTQIVYPVSADLRHGTKVTVIEQP